MRRLRHCNYRTSFSTKRRERGVLQRLLSEQKACARFSQIKPQPPHFCKSSGGFGLSAAVYFFVFLMYYCSSCGGARLSVERRNGIVDTQGVSWKQCRGCGTVVDADVRDCPECSSWTADVIYPTLEELLVFASQGKLWTKDYDLLNFRAQRAASA